MPEILVINIAYHATPADLEIFYHEILKPSFDPAELIERSQLLGALADTKSATHYAIAFDQAGLIVGGIIGDCFDECGVLLISYLVARREFRGCGIGTRLLAEVVPAWKAKFAAELVVLEVEDPRFYSADEDHGDPAKRLRLYASLGARILRMPYFQPALSAGQPRVPNLFLMVFTADQSVMTETNSVDAAPLRCFWQEYLGGAEGDVDDRAVRAVRDALAKDAIPLVDPAEYLRKA
jgi:GNAT superfamily N-acetyltransferase